MRIAVLGTGAMGSRIARGLIRNGHDVVVWNRHRDHIPGDLAVDAGIAATPAEAASRVDLVLSIVRDDEASERVWFGAHGAADVLRAGTVAVESSTLSVSGCRAISDRLALRERSFVAAPLVGSRPQADAGQLTVLTAGAATACVRVHDVFAGLASPRRVGEEPVMATTVKLAVNFLLATQVRALDEATEFSREAAGVELGSLLDLISDLPVMSPALSRLGDAARDQAFAPNFPIDLVAKDLRYALAAAPYAGDLRTAVLDRLQKSVDRGDGGLDIAGVLKATRNRDLVT